MYNVSCLWQKYRILELTGVVIYSRAVILSLGVWLTVCSSVPAQRQLENLTRGVVALKTANDQVFVGWRALGTDPPSIAFNLYRAVNGGLPTKVNDEPITGATNFTDADADTRQPC